MSVSPAATSQAKVVCKWRPDRSLSPSGKSRVNASQDWRLQFRRAACTGPDCPCRHAQATKPLGSGHSFRSTWMSNYRKHTGQANAGCIVCCIERLNQSQCIDLPTLVRCSTTAFELARLTSAACWPLLSRRPRARLIALQPMNAPCRRMLLRASSMSDSPGPPTLVGRNRLRIGHAIDTQDA